jgi:hypothetical protein
MSYEVVDPEKLYYGKSYSDLVEDWVNWFLSVDADRRNSGPVVFLRSKGMPPSKHNANDYNASTEMSVSATYAEDPYYERPYANLPVVKVGGDKLVIREDQAVFIPIILAFQVAEKPYFDWGSMSDFTGQLIDNGDSPPRPDQLTINGVPIETPLIESKSDMKKFRIVTSIFTAIVPEADYGRSIKDFLEESLVPGEHAAIADGYFVLVRNFKPGRTYLIHSRASAGREKSGPYYSEFIYQISVEARSQRESEGIIPSRPPGNDSIIRRILREKVDKGEITEGQHEEILKNSDLLEDKGKRNPKKL